MPKLHLGTRFGLEVELFSAERPSNEVQLREQAPFPSSTWERGNELGNEGRVWKLRKDREGGRRMEIRNKPKSSNDRFTKTELVSNSD